MAKDAAQSLTMVVVTIYALTSEIIVLLWMGIKIPNLLERCVMYVFG